MIAVSEDVYAWTARPTSLDEVASMMRFAAGRRRSVLPFGSGSKLSWRSVPAKAGLRLSSGALAAWSYEPGAETVTVGAGVPVSVAQARLAAYGRRLPIDPPSSGATIGGVLATDESGPLAELYGTPRETLLRATGVRAGGGVVRDDVSLDWLDDRSGRGVLVDATFRVTRIPTARRWVSRTISSPVEAFELVAALRQRGVGPSAIEMDLPAEGLGRLAVLIEGSIDSGTERAVDVTDLFSPGASFSDLPPAWWGRYPWRTGQVALRMVAPGSGLRTIAYALRDAAGVRTARRSARGDRTRAGHRRPDHRGAGARHSRWRPYRPFGPATTGQRGGPIPHVVTGVLPPRIALESVMCARSTHMWNTPHL
jgi:glycolate oxidase FAD binding subunit